jgi:hypothetical protein
MRRQEQQNNIKDVYNRINTVNKELTDKIEDTERTILGEIKNLRDELSKNKEGIGDRLGKIETWKYGVGIVIIVLAWLAGQTNVLENIIGK